MDKIIGIPTLGSRVKDERCARGWSTADLAERSEMSTSALWEIESNRTDPRTSTLVRLADALSVSVAKIITGKDDGYRKGYKAALRDVQSYLKTMDQ